jgi:hypothetical protein
VKNLLAIITVLVATSSLTPGSPNTIIVTRERSYFKAPGQPARNFFRWIFAAPVNVEAQPAGGGE